MTDELKQWECDKGYTKGYSDGRASLIKEIKYDITIIRITYDGTAAEKIALVGASEAMALKILEVFGLPGYDIKICGYTYPENRKKGEDKLWT